MDADRMERGIEGWSMPISLPLPVDVEVTDDDRRIAWRLELRAPTAGIDFFANFPLPVVTGTPGDDALTQASVGEAAVAAMNDETLERLYQKAGLQRTASPGSLRLVSPPFRLRGGNVAMVAFGLIFGGFGSGIGLLIGLEGRSLNWGPLIIGGIFALIGLLVMWGGIMGFLRTFHVEVDRHGIVLRKGLFSPGAALRHERANISAIAVREVYATNGVPRCRVTIEPSQGRSIALTPVVGDNQEAEMIAADIRAALG